jgi:hypothetical protein
MTLLARAQAGDREALDLLIIRFLPRMRRWAHGRLPPFARDLFNPYYGAMPEKDTAAIRARVQRRMVKAPCWE